MIGPTWLYHPLGQCAGSWTSPEYLRCRSYNFWSGIGSDIGELTLIVSTIIAVVTVIRIARKAYNHHFECHEEGCSRHGKYVIEGGVRCCDLHHPALDDRDERDRGHVYRLHTAHIAHIEQQRSAVAPARGG